MFLENEQMYNKASNYYREITLLTSKTFQYIVFGSIILNCVVIIAFANAVGLSFGLTDALPVFIGIVCEVAFIFLILRIVRIDEYRFNKLVREGILLKTNINHRLSRKMLLGKSQALQIFSYYICDNGEKMTFSQTKKLNILKEFDILLENKLEQESYISVLVNPIKCSEYYILIQEIGVKPERKCEVLYGNKIVSIIFLFLLVLEYVIWIVYF